MPTTRELEAQRKAEEEQRKRDDAARSYYEAAKLFANVAVGDVVKRAEYTKLLKTAERTMRKTFDDAHERMTQLSIKALRGERV